MEKAHLFSMHSVLDSQHHRWVQEIFDENVFHPNEKWRFLGTKGLSVDKIHKNLPLKLPLLNLFAEKMFMALNGKTVETESLENFKKVILFKKYFTLLFPISLKFFCSSDHNSYFSMSLDIYKTLSSGLMYYWVW